MRAHGRNVPVRDLCLLEAAWARLVCVARLAPMSRCTGKSNAEARSGLHSRTRLPRAYESKLTNILVRRGAPAASPVPATPTQRAHMMGIATKQKRRAFAGGPARRASARTGSGMVLEAAARVGSCLWTACGCDAPHTPNRGTRTQHSPRAFRAHENR